MGQPSAGPNRAPTAPAPAPPWVMRRRSDRASREKALVATEEETKSAGRKGEHGPEEFQCSGVLEQDFPELCARAGITHAPRVTVRPAPSFPADAEPPAGTLEEALARIERKYRSFQPRIQVEREQEDPRSVRAVFLRGWKLEEEMLGVLSQCLPALGALQALHLWNVPLPEPLLPVLAALPTRCSRLRTLNLEGNPLPEAAFQLLMGSDSLWRHLSLRCCSIGDAAAQRIGRSLSTPSGCNQRLQSLVLSFNRIADRGAQRIAEGLRLNRSLLSLSLASNDIGDAGASALAQVLAPFALTQEEEAQRRRLLLAEALGRRRASPKETEPRGDPAASRGGSIAGSKGPPARPGRAGPRRKEPPRKEELKQSKKLPDPKLPRSRDPRAGAQKPSADAELPSGLREPLAGAGGPGALLEARALRGSVLLPGNRALRSLSLDHNRVSERGLGAFLAALEAQQREEQKGPGQQGLEWLGLESNRIPPTSPALARLQELLPLEPGPKAPAQEEEQDAGT
ncbi:leucine-rich repeat-containing protein 71 isoform X3 [Lathamus discolor]|uniref:leucine-rich repeat-containing protein 71 isoform X3 n=1 Tax=Lathamus discolor TaxID=678569 RepID=UPI0032B84C04